MLYATPAMPLLDDARLLFYAAEAIDFAIAAATPGFATPPIRLFFADAAISISPLPQPRFIFAFFFTLARYADAAFILRFLSFRCR